MPYDRSRRLTRDEELEIVTLYLCGLSMEETARQTDTHPTTIKKVLARRGVEERQSWTTRTKQDTCARGHDMATHARILYRKNAAGEKVPSGRECTECKRMRGRKAWKNQG